MQPYASSRNRYQKTDISTADPLRLVVLLYEGILKHIGGALLSAKESNIEARCNHINRALAMIAELQATLNFEKGGDVAKNLNNLYNYWRRRLIEANMQNSVELLEEVRHLVSELWSAWDEVASRNSNRETPGSPPPTVSTTAFRA